jgi:hypothetical protein
MGSKHWRDSLAFAAEHKVLTRHRGPKSVCVSDSGLFPHIRWGCVVRRSVRNSVRDPGSLLTFSRLLNGVPLESKIRVRRSVVSAEAERERSRLEALHDPSLQRFHLSGRVEGITGPPWVGLFPGCSSRRSVMGEAKRASELPHSNDAHTARRTPSHRH